MGNKEYNKRKFLEMKVQNPEIDEFGTKHWRNENGKHHRLDGPAWEDVKGNKFWCQYGKYHRLDGPAIELIDGDRHWFIEGEEYIEEEFNWKLHQINLKKQASPHAKEFSVTKEK